MDMRVEMAEVAVLMAEEVERMVQVAEMVV